MPPMFPELPPVLDAAGMRAVDAETINRVGIPGFTLMESAGREVARVAQEMIELNRFDEFESDQAAPSASICCLCGSGNNGGDGFVVARYLSGYGHKVTVVLCSNSDLQGEAKQHFEILQQIAKEPGIELEISTPKLSSEQDVLEILRQLDKPDLVVDAILGTGLQQAVRPKLVPFIEWMNACGSPILSIDIPSGLSADTGAVLGTCVDAHVTVTLASLKAGLIIGDGPDVVGALHVVDIGIPAFAVDHMCSDAREIRLSNNGYVRSRLPEPHRTDHKFTTGPCLVVGGSDSYTGAPVLASQAAGRSGSGYVVCIGPASIHRVLQEKLTEIPVASWDDAPSETAAQHLMERLDSRWEKAKSLLIGPGLGREKGLPIFIKTLLTHFKGPVVLDADALPALAGQKDWVQKNSAGKWIFTPHEGELNKLRGESPSEQTNPGISRIETARSFAKEWNVVLLLKGFPTLVALPSGAVVINATGQASAATAGSGDVLAGVIAGFLSRGLSPADAAICGIHVAGTATDLYVEENAPGTMMAGDILSFIPRVLSEL